MNGLKAHCVQLEIDVTELRKQLESSGMSDYEKRVDYMEESSFAQKGYERIVEATLFNIDDMPGTTHIRLCLKFRIVSISL